MKKIIRRIAIACTCGLSLLGAVGCVSGDGNIGEGYFKTKAKYSLKSANAGEDELTEISYLKSVGREYMLLATGFDDTTLSKANALAAELETHATLGYVVNGVNHESNKYYDAIATSNEGSDNKTWTAQDIFGETEKVHMIVEEIEMGQTVDFTVKAYIKVGDNIVAEQSRDIKTKAKVYAEKEFTHSFNPDKGVFSGWMEGAKVGQLDHETYPSEIMPDDLVKITYLFNFTEFKDLETQVYLVCKTWYENARARGTEVNPSEQVTLSFAESGIRLGKVAISYIVKVPGTFATTEYRLHPSELYPMVGFTSGVCGTFDKVIFSDPAGDLDYKIEGYYETKPVEFKTPFFGTYEKLLVSSEYTFECTTKGTDWSEWLKTEPSFGGGLGIPIDLKAGDIVDATVLLDVKDLGSQPQIWCVARSWEPNNVSEDTFDMTGKIHTGKIAFTFSFCWPKSLASSADGLLMPQFRFKDINCSSTKYIITSHNTNLYDYISEDYDVLDKEYMLPGPLSTKEKIGLLGFGEYDNVPIALGSWYEGRRIGGAGYDQVLVKDELINIQYDFTLTDASKVNSIKFECGTSYTTWNGGTINAGDSITLSKDEFNLKNGHIILSFTLKIPADFVYNQNDIYPRIVLIGDSTDIIGTAKRVIFNRDGYDMSMFTRDAELVLDYEMKTKYFGTFPKVSDTIDVSYWGTCDCEQGVWSGNFEGVYFAGRHPTEIGKGDKYQITLLANIEQIKDVNAKIRTTPRTWFSGVAVTSSEEVLGSDVGLCTGKVAFTYVVQINGEYNSHINELDVILNFYGLKLSFSQIIATKYGTDLSKLVPEEYKVLTPHVITTGFFAVSGN